MSFAHIGEIKEVSGLIEANLLLEAGHELLQILPGKTSDGDPCTLFYLGKAAAKVGRVKVSKEAVAKAAQKR